MIVSDFLAKTNWNQMKTLLNGFKQLKGMYYDLLRHISKSLNVINETNETNNLQLGELK